MQIEPLKPRIDSIFDSNSEIIKEYSKRGYWIPKETSDNSIFFLGLNPSYPHKNYEITDRIYYDIKQQNDHYFSPLEALCKSVINENKQVTWTHLDLLMIRETKQSEIKKLLKTSIGKDFVYNNIIIAKEIIEKSKPKIIVVVNTLTRDLLKDKEYGGYNFTWDDNIGTYRFGDESTLFGTPIIFSGMISGQRALDIGSRERLSWHIKYVLKEEKLI